MIVPLLDPGEGYHSANIARQRRLNFYIEQSNDRTPLAMYGTPGLTLLATLGGVVRGAYAVSGFAGAYVVAGNIVYTVNTLGVIFALTGSLVTTTGRVYMADNGAQLLIVDGTAGYIVNYGGGSNTVVKITDPNFPVAATSCCFLGGYFIVNKSTSGQFWWSNIYDGLTWSALQFATAETNPDYLIFVIQSRGELILWGERSIEIWALSQDSQVFRRIGGAAIEWGLASVNSVDRFGDDLIFLAKNRMGQFCVAVLSGYTVTPVSTPEVEFDLQQQGFVAPAATAFSYRWFGHNMYQINFPNKSYLYDGISNAWSEVGSNPAGTAPGRHYGEIRWEVIGRPYVSDYRNGNIYLVDGANFTDNGDPIISEWVTKHVFEPNLGYVTIDEFQVDMETGIGLSTGQGSQPQIMLSTSKDGGHTFGNERWLPGGAQGNYTNKAYALGLGVARDFTVKMRISDPVKRAIANVQLRIR